MRLNSDRTVVGIGGRSSFSDRPPEINTAMSTSSEMTKYTPHERWKERMQDLPSSSTPDHKQKTRYQRQRNQRRGSITCSFGGTTSERRLSQHLPQLYSCTTLCTTRQIRHKRIRNKSTTTTKPRAHLVCASLTDHFERVYVAPVGRLLCHVQLPPRQQFRLAVGVRVIDEAVGVRVVVGTVHH